MGGSWNSLLLIEVFFRSAEIKCLQILRTHVLGDRPVQVEYLSDPAVDFAHCSSKCVNYENPNLNIGLPVFSIHGNHDDPSGLGGHSCLDLVHEAGLVNYFGKVSCLVMAFGCGLYHGLAGDRP